MRLAIIAFLAMTSAASAAPRLDCGAGAELVGQLNSLPSRDVEPTDFQGYITVGSGDPTSCILFYEVTRDPKLMCIVRWPPQSPRILRGLYRMETDKLVVTSQTMSNTKIAYNCHLPR